MRRAVFPLMMIVCLAACGDRDEGKFLEGAQQSATDSAAHPGSPGGTALVPEVESGSTVLVTIQDGRMLVANPDQIPAGPVVFTFKNSGSAVHSAFIEGEGFNRALHDNLAAGAEASLDGNLTAAKYIIYCPILDHRQKGEAVELTIKPPSAPAPTSTVEPLATTSS
jgi:hypothetical protein